ncbi:MAG: hypothetical protein IJL61_05300 [Bacteroidales bacterium]|nr:hypothetical protein [Bacteroidales bacterium]
MVSITNNGKENSKVITDFYPLYHSFNSHSFDSLEVHTNKGDDCTAQSYEPYTVKFEKGKKEVFEPAFGGKSTTGDRGWPYWNIQNGNKGIILALG